MSDVLFGHSYYLRFDPKLWKAMQPYPPLGTMYAASYLRQRGYDVALYDAMLAESEAQWAEALDRERPRYAVLYEDNFNYLSKMCLLRMRQAALTMIREARARGCTVIASGADATDHADLYLRQGAQFVLIGEGEHTLGELMDRLTGRSDTAIESIRGLAHLDGAQEGQPMRTSPRPEIQDLDALPFPAWDLVDVPVYESIWRRRHGYYSMNVVTSRGCPYHCTWCAKPIWGQRYNARSPESVVAELTWLKRTYNPDHIWFVDDILGIQPGWIQRLADLLEQHDARLPFKSLHRADLLLREDTIPALRRAGAQMVWMGAESGSQRILDAMEKGTRVEQIREATRRLHDAGIQVCLFLQFGYPGEGRDDVEATFQMVRDCRPDDIGVSVSYPLPGTKFYDSVKQQLGAKQNWIDSNDLAIMYEGPFSTAFYRKLHTVLHKEFRARKIWRALGRVARHPTTARPRHLRQAAAMAWYGGTLPLERLRLERLAGGRGTGVRDQGSGDGGRGSDGPDSPSSNVGDENQGSGFGPSRPLTPAPRPPRRKIVLYNPRAVFYTMPLALLAVGSCLDPSRYDVRIIDGRLEKDPVGAVAAEIDDALCLGVTVLTGAPIQDALLVTRAARARRPDLFIVWGGWHPSLFPVETLNESGADAIVQGQGESTFVELVELLAQSEKPTAVQGATLRVDGRAVSKAPRPLADLDGFPARNYDLISVERYFALKGARQLDYVSSAGCQFRCAFCADPFVYARRWTGLSPERIGDEVERLWRRYQFTDLAFQDDTFFTRRKSVAAMAEEFLRRGLRFTWTATMRADQGVRLTDDVYALCVRAGLRRLMIGVETGAQEMLDWMTKDITTEQVLECAARCARHEIGAIFPFIVGFPGETDASVRATLDLVKRLRAMSPRFETPIFYYKPYPGSRIAADVVRTGYALPATLEEWARFDYVGSSSPWVGPETHQLVERFKFFNRFAWGPETRLRRPLQAIARWRCRRDFYGLPVEKIMVERLKPLQRLS